MDLPEEIKQVLEGGLFGVIGYFDGFCVACFVGAYLAIGWVCLLSADVSDLRGDDAFDGPKRCLDAPETPGRECGFFVFDGFCGLFDYRRDGRFRLWILSRAGFVRAQYLNAVSGRTVWIDSGDLLFLRITHIVGFFLRATAHRDDGDEYC